jgi:hypothetical protein
MAGDPQLGDGYQPMVQVETMTPIWPSPHPKPAGGRRQSSSKELEKQ